MTAPNARTVRQIPFEAIERRFRLGSYWFGERWCPAVTRHGGGYQIRVVASTAVSLGGAKTTYDYFQLSADGTVVAAPRGHAHEFKPGRVVGLAAAVKRFATPDPSALRLNFGSLS